MKGLLISFITVLYLTILLFTAMVVLAFANYEGTATTVLTVFIWISAVAACGLGFANFILGVVQIFKPKKNPYKTVMICKLVLIPFFIMNFVYLALVFIGSLNPFLIWLLPIIIFLAILTYGILLATSAYNAGYLIYRLRKGEGPFVEQIIFVVLHFLYIIDVIASVVLFVKNKENDGIEFMQN